MGTDKVIFVGEQWGATGSDVTGSYMTGSDRKSHDRKRRCPEPEVCYAQPEVSQYPLVGPSHRKWRQWPEVIVCACATGTFCITTRVVVQVPWLPVTEGVEGCAHAQPEVAQYPPSGAFSPEVDYRKWRHFPHAFFLVVLQNVGWGYSLRLPLSLVICPFYFHNYI